MKELNHFRWRVIEDDNDDAVDADTTNTSQKEIFEVIFLDYVLKFISFNSTKFIILNYKWHFSYKKNHFTNYNTKNNQMHHSFFSTKFE